MAEKFLSIASTVLAGVCAAGLSALAALALSRGSAAYGAGYSARTARAMEDLFLFVSPRKLAERAAAAAAVVAALVFLAIGGVGGGGGAVAVRAAIALLAAGLVLAAPSRLVKVLKARRRARFEAQFEGALTDMAGALRSGFSILQAMEHVAGSAEAPLSEEFDATLHQIRVGVPFEEALRNMSGSVGSEDLSLAVTAIETARRSGGNLAEVFNTISSTIRARLRIRARVKTLTAQGRMQGVILTVMPVALGFALAAMQPGMFSPFVHSASGLAVLCGAALLLLLGAISIRRITTIDV